MQYLKNQASETILLQDAWELLTQHAVPFPGVENGGLFPAVKTWLDQIVVQQSVFPTETERKNNRVFAGLYQKSKSPMEIQKSIERFYHYNCGQKEVVEQNQAHFVQTFQSEIFARLSGRLDAGAFPMKLIDAMENELNTIQSIPVQLSIPTWESKGLFASVTEHVNQQCEATEEVLHRYYQALQRKRYAESVRDILNSVSAFVSNAKALPGELDKMLRQLHTPQHLEEKYGKYFAQVLHTINQKRGKLFIGASGQKYFDALGLTLAEEWWAIIRQTAAGIGDNLPAECRGTFCKIIEWEYNSNEGLNSFFNNYLASSRRMLKENFDTPGSAQSLYIMDSAFAVHHWAKENKKSIINANNDNVERIDLFVLQKDLPWYIENNRYFQGSDAQQDDAQGPVPLFDGHSVPIADIRADTQKSFAQEPAGESLQNADKHSICIHFMHNRYVLTWDWEAGADHAVVMISQPQGVNRSIPCSIQDFNAPVGGVPNGIDITDSLPYGKVSIEIRSQNGTYAKRDVSGKKRGRTVPL